MKMNTPGAIQLTPLLLACFTAASLLGQVLPAGNNAASTSATILESGPDYRSWQSLDPVRANTPGNGQMVELATGMNYWDGTNWSPSVPQFLANPQDSSFVATKVQHQTRISSDINVAGAVGVTTPDGQVLSSTPIGIGLFDAASGAFQLIATVTNTPGVMISTNQVYFENAFTGGACASILYTIYQDSFAQDIIFTGYLDPAAYGFPTNTTRIQVITEFYQPPTPDVLRQPMEVENNRVLRQTMASPDLIDETLTFGRVVFGVGQAYTVPSLLEPSGSASLVAKEMVQTTDGRSLLIESAPYSALQNGFYSLPDCATAGGAQGGALPRGSRKSVLVSLPHPPRSSKTKFAEVPTLHFALRTPAEASPSPLQSGEGRGEGSVASNVSNQPSKNHFSLLKRPSVWIDYRATLNTGAVLAQCDTTYLISGHVACNTLTLEGGAVLKYKVGAFITANPVVSKNSGLYRPTVFTAVDDDTVGESMKGYLNSGYNGYITNTGYANPALGFTFSPQTATGCVFRYAQKAIQYSITGTAGATINLTHVQLFNCIRGIDLTWAGCGSSGGSSPITLAINNVLIAGVQNPINHANLNCTVTPTLINCTIDQAANIVGGSGSLSFSSINSIYANITNSTSGTFSGNNNGFFNSAQTFGGSKLTVSSSPFQSVGAGNYYLTDASGFRNAGTSSGVSSSLMSDLGKRTTYPPVIQAMSLVSAPQTYYPQAQRDTDTLDLGYHYDPLDWELGGILYTNATVTVNIGTAIGVFGTNTSTYGLAIGQAATLQCQGTPNNQNWFAQFNTVQEQPYTNWFQTSGGALSSEFQGLSPGSVINCRLTAFSTLSQAVPGFLGATNTGPLNFQDCEFHGGTLISSNPTVNLTNCLLERVYTDLEPRDGLTNYVGVGLVYGGNFTFAPSNSLVQDVLFDSPSITNWNGYSGGFNAYVTNLTRLQPTKSTDVILTSSPSYQAGPLGQYYILTNSVLINADTTTSATNVGLYHYTVCTNIVSGYEVKETNSWVDVSYHYVATDANGNPEDINGDGIPDYLEDSNGNGLVDSGEIGWNITGDLGLKVLITRPKNNSVIP